MNDNDYLNKIYKRFYFIKEDNINDIIDSILSNNDMYYDFDNIKMIYNHIHILEGIIKNQINYNYN